MNRSSFDRPWCWIRTFGIAACAVLAASCREGVDAPNSGPPPGPPSIIVWERAPGAPLLVITALRTNSLGTVFASAVTGSLHRSTDDGATWQDLPTGTGGAFGSIATEGLTVLAGNGTRGIMRSTDNGEHWSRSDSGIADLQVLSVAAMPGHRFFAGTQSGRLYLSTDGGASWDSVGNVARAIVAIGASAEGTILLSAWDHGVYRFLEPAGTFLDADAGMDNPYVTCFSVSSAGVLFAGTYASGIYTTSDNGASWRHLDDGPTDAVRTIAEPSAGVVLAGTGHGIFHSVDRGLHWTRADSGLTAPDVRALDLTPAGRLFAGTSDGVFRSVDEARSRITKAHR